MRFRLANPKDAWELAQIHYECRDRLPQSFMIGLGVGFLKCYYSVILEQRTTVVLCAEDPLRGLVGFVSGTTDARSELESLRGAKWRLCLAAIPILARRPALFLRMMERMRGKDVDGGEGFFIYESGARAAFWGWRERTGSGADAIVLFRKWLRIMQVLGIRLVRGEVDCENTKVQALHWAMGAEVERQFVTPEGRKRDLIVYDNEKLNPERPLGVKNNGEAWCGLGTQEEGRTE